ncbi:MAG: acyltransferase, partial [Proteobacteria bacterium]|nr:acyltransferase [Pseudomonadota bacterium]
MQANPQANLEVSLAQVQEAAHEGADLVVLCELHTSLYFCQEKSARHFRLAQE